MIVSVVSGTYNRLRHLMNMIHTARQSIPYGIAYEFVIVDGGSTDGTLEWLRAQSDVRLIEHHALKGAIAAFNEGAYAARGNYVLLANDDIEFIGSSIARGIRFLEESKEPRIGCFQQDRNGKPWHLENFSARLDGELTMLPYPQVCILPRWLGDKLEWWTLPGARTYGGDTALGARAWSHGVHCEAIPDAFIRDTTPDDELRRINGTTGTGSPHPDTEAYYRAYPDSPLARNDCDLPWPSGHRVRERILYCPIFEPGSRHDIQRQQKRGLRRALQRIGYVWEVDYLAGDDIFAAAEVWKPDLVLTQFHRDGDCRPEHSRRLREIVGDATMVNWCGDVYRDNLTDKYADMLRSFDLHTCVNQDAVEDFTKLGIPAAYWQCAYEPDGVGYEPDADTPQHDILFLGNAYSEQRQRFGATIHNWGNVGIYGTGWQNGLSSGDTTYDFRRGCQLLRNARIALSDNQWSSENRGFVSNRIFQTLAAGKVVLFQQHVPDLDKLTGLIAGIHYVEWSDVSDLREKIDYYLTHEEERHIMQINGTHYCLLHHSFEVRLRELYKLLKAPTLESL